MGQGTSQQAVWIPACFEEERTSNTVDKAVGFVPGILIYYHGHTLGVWRTNSSFPM